MNNPLRNEGRPIFDPFAGVNSVPEEVSIGAPPARNEYETHRPCGHCRGNGKKLDDKSGGLAVEAACSQCLLGGHVKGKVATEKGEVILWGRVAKLFAFELTDAEIRQLPPEKCLGAQCERGQHDEQRRIARIMSDEQMTAGKAVIIKRVRTFV